MNAAKKMIPLVMLWRQCSRLPPLYKNHKQPWSSNASLQISHSQPDLLLLTATLAVAMVIALGPGKFYGSSLPRPRFYTDVKFNSERVDPPIPVMDPLMAWANEAHWAMGGLSFKRLRLQGRIEGNIERLRVQRDRDSRKQIQRSVSDDAEENEEEISRSPSPPPAPVAIKRRRVVGLEEESEIGIKKGPVRKLRDDFERLASESGMVVDTSYASDPAVDDGDDDDCGGNKKRNQKAAKGKRKLVKGGRIGKAATRNRRSPRLART